MAQGDILKRYLDAGLAFTQLTRERAEAIVQDLVKAGTIRRKEAESVLEDLVERSRKNTDELISIVRREVAEQIRNLGLEDLAARAGVRLGTAASETPNAADSTLPVPEPAGPAVKAAAAKAARKASKKAAPAKKATAAKKAPGASKAKSAKKAGGSKKGA